MYHNLSYELYHLCREGKNKRIEEMFTNMREILRKEGKSVHDFKSIVDLDGGFNNACFGGKEDTVKLLIQYKADAFGTGLQNAKYKKHWDIAETMLLMGAIDDTKMTADKCLMFLNRGVNPKNLNTDSVKNYILIRELRVKNVTEIMLEMTYLPKDVINQFVQFIDYGELLIEEENSTEEKENKKRKAIDVTTESMTNVAPLTNVASLTNVAPLTDVIDMHLIPYMHCNISSRYEEF